MVALAIAALTAVAVTAASDAQREPVYGAMSELIGREAARFDGRDADYRGVDPLGDPKGRFAVWAQRIDGPLKIEAFEDEPGNPWADDDYYVKPLEAPGDVVLDPYFDSDAMTSYTTAIKRDGRAVGVAAVDVELSALDAQAKAVDVLDSGYAFVATRTGPLVAFPARTKFSV